MHITKLLAATALAVVSSAAFADTTTYNDTPTAGYFFGNNTNYSPANSAVLTTDQGDQLFLRWHERYPQSLASPASNGSVYSFGQNIQAPSFDFGVTSSTGLTGLSGLLTVSNLGTGQSVQFNPFLIPDNVTQGNTVENSENLSFSFLSGVGFQQGVNNTYRVTLDVTGLTGGPKSLFVDAQIGDGAVGDVPEPATWAMMIGGFGLVGASMRRRRTAVRFA